MQVDRTLTGYRAQLAAVRAEPNLPTRVRATLIRFFQDLIRQEEANTTSPLRSSDLRRALKSRSSSHRRTSRAGNGSSRRKTRSGNR